MDRDELARKAHLLKGATPTERATRAVAGVEAELRGEAAASMGRAADKVAAALAALRAADPGDSPEAIAAFNALRDRALRAKWELRVHREAVGLRSHDALDALYPVPPRRR